MQKRLPRKPRSSRRAASTSSASAAHREQGRRRFVEDMGIVFEQFGLPRMAGRCFGWLLICSPPHQTAAQLGEAVGASKGSISSMVRLLARSKLVERFSVPGERAVRYRITEGSWSQMMDSKLQGMRLMRALAERGVALLRDEEARVRARVERMRDIYVFFEREWPLVIERYERRRAARGKGRE